MKWFHHECAARYDPKLQILGSQYGSEGIGIYWGLLEEIGQHSDTFYLKVTGVNEEIDQKYLKTLHSFRESSTTSFAATNIPVLPIKILSRNLFASPKRVIQVIQTAAEIGLFDLQKWTEFNVLYSQSFEQRADDYTRRLLRKTDKNRTDTGHSADNVRTPSEVRQDSSGETPNHIQSESKNVRPEAETKTESEEEKDSKADIHAGNIFISKINMEEYERLKNEPYLVDLDEKGFHDYCEKFRSIIVKWNDENRNKFNWNPSDDELNKIFRAGTYDHKVSICYDAYKILHEKIHYPELVLRALQLMLKASGKTRIANPFGWLWSCMHGNSDGTTPWVQLLTAKEESNIVSHLRSRHLSDISSIQSRHPP